jgi:alpha-mannosidase
MKKTLFLMLLPMLYLCLSADEVPRIYLGNDDHTDYLWSGNAADYKTAFSHMIKYYLDRADATDQQPADFQARFNCDGSLWMWEYERSHPDDFPRFIRRIRDGHISVPLTPITLCYGAQSAEGVLRGMYYAGRIERLYNLRFLTAQPMEDQTIPFGVGSLFAGSGAQYCWMAICGCATRLPDYKDKRDHEIYWWQGNDKSRRLLIKWNSARFDLDKSYTIGEYAEARFDKFTTPAGVPFFDPLISPSAGPAAVVDFLETDLKQNSLWQYPLVKAAFGFGGDELETTTRAFEEAARQKSTAKRRVINSNEIDFFQDFEKTYAQGPKFPHYSAAFGNEWDLYPASMAEVSARVKRGIEKLRTAEAMAALVSLKEPHFMDDRQSSRDLAFMNMGLYFNHDWTCDRDETWRNAFEQWAKELAAQVESYVENLQADASSLLGDLIRKGDQNPRFFVFNPLSWERTDAADFPYAGPVPVHVIDLASNRETPSQIVTMANRGQILRILARGVPSVGYKVFEIRSGAGTPPQGSISVHAENGTFSNAYYSLKVGANGSITSLYDKASQQEFARKINGRWLNDLGEGTGIWEVENAGPVSVTLKVRDVPTPLKHTTRITLYHHSKRLDIQNEITQNFSSQGDNPPVWAFSFNLDSPDIWHEEVGDVIRAKLEPVGHYARNHARYDWLTLNHFADISSGQRGVTLANSDCLFMKTGESTLTSLDDTTPQIKVLVGGQIDGAKLGILKQGGSNYFLQRFALQTHGAYSQAQAMRFGLEHQNPLVTGLVKGAKDSLDGKSYSLLSISDPEVLLWSLKPAEDGVLQGGMALRVWNQSCANSNFEVALKGCKIAAAKRATHIETPTGDAKVDRTMLLGTAAGHALETYLLQISFP